MGPRAIAEARRAVGGPELGPEGAGLPLDVGHPGYPTAPALGGAGAEPGTGALSRAVDAPRASLTRGRPVGAVAATVSLCERRSRHEPESNEDRASEHCMPRHPYRLP